MSTNSLDVSRVLPTLPPFTGLLRVSAGDNPTLTICSPTFWVIRCHWVKNRSFAHLQQKEKCIGCQKAWPLKARSLLLVVSGPKKKEEFLDLTIDASLELQDLAPRPENLRGLIVKCGRVGKTTRGRIRIDVVGMDTATEQLPQDKSPEASCLRLWGESPDLIGQVDVT